MKILLSLKYLLCILFVARGITLSQSTPQKFLDALIYNKPEITDYVNKDELTKSQRLGISYTGAKEKCLIGYDLPEEIQAGILTGKYKYEIKELPVEDGFTEVNFLVPDANFSRVYYFRGGFVTNSTYFSGKWISKQSKYFTFSIEEPKYFNDYCIKRLDDFVDMIADTLGFTILEKSILEEQKIGYIFCADERGVEKITGFKAKGMAMLGSDEVVTSYQTHFHEVAHILINYKLKSLGLYTLPFFMEGFAVAVGGRGGMAPRVVTDLGYYLEKSSILTYDSILTNEGFYNYDASMSYAVSGLYNAFLLSELGGEKYLELYKKANGNLEFIKNISLNSLDLLPTTKWNSFLEDYNKTPSVYFDKIDTNTLFDGGNMGSIDILKNGYIRFTMPQYIFVDFLNNRISKSLYTSRLFLTDFPKDSSKWEYAFQFGVFADSNSLKVIDFYNDELLVNYNKNLSIENLNIPAPSNRFQFYIYGGIFSIEEIKGYVVSEIILRSLYYK